MSSRELLENLSFCVLDLETTGGNHTTDRIIEIGMVRVENLQLGEEKNLLIDPKKPIPEFIQKLTSIKQKDVTGKPQIHEVIDEVLDFIGDDIIVAHNTSFDVPFLNGVLARLGREPLTNKVICTNVMTKHMIPDIMNSNLNYMSQLFEINHSNAHRAHDDARATAKLLLKFLESFIQKGIKKVNQLYYPKNKFELDRIHYENNTDHKVIINKILENNCSMLILLKGERGLILGTLPIENPKEEIEFIKKFLTMIDWEILTIRLIKPILEGIFRFNNHFSKYDETLRENVLEYLENRYGKSTDTPKEYSIAHLDFIVSHHLVREQFVVYSFLNLNTSTKAIFKFPAQKKKMLTNLKSLINRFENNQKGSRRHNLHAEIIPIVESLLIANKDSGKYLSLSRKMVKGSDSSVFKILDSFSKENDTSYNFPNSSL